MMNSAEKKRVLAIIGHPQRSGSCITLLNAAVHVLCDSNFEVQTVHLADYAIQACGAHHVCAQGEGCVIRDEMWKLYPLIANCRGLIVATPVFFHGLPSGLKALVDRCQPFWEDRYRIKRNRLPMRPGMVILTAGSRHRPGFSAVHECLDSFFESVAIDSVETLEVGGLDWTGPVENHPEWMQDARRRGERFVTAVNTHCEAGQITHPWWDKDRSVGADE